MKQFSTPKEALLDAGRIKAITRGRISADNHEWLEKEIAAKRIAITGAVVAKRTNKSGVEKTVVKSSNVATEKHIPDVTILYPKDQYHAVGNDGKTYGMPEVCNNCMVSLVQNQCDDPVILGGIHVRIVPNA